MTRASPGEPAVALDAVRAAAALLVLLSHARDMLVRDAADTPALSLPSQAFMALSGLGHQAVIVFFVLSGYLVTAAMLRLHAAGRWSLPAFALSRLTRLWVVLLPCLVLGGGLDAIGLALRGSAAATPYGIPPLTPVGLAPTLDLAVGLGNAVFLQTIAVPVFGSNGALWSLANEAWYYALAALAFAAWHTRRTPVAAALPFAAAAALACALPHPILQLAPVWAFGAAVALRPAATSVHAARTGTALLGFVAILAASRLRVGPSLVALDLLLGLATALLVRSLAVVPNPAPNPVSAAVRRLSRLSYSLYLSHCPVLALFALLALGGARPSVGAEAVARVIVGMGLALGVAWVLWWAFERHTDRCRRTILHALMRCTPATLQPLAQGGGS